MGQTTFKDVTFGQNIGLAVITGAETIVLTSRRLPLEYDTARVMIYGWMQITLGLGTTGVVLRFRRGTALTDPEVGSSVVEAASASIIATFTYAFLDRLQGVGEVQYVLTVQQQAATGNATVTNASLDTELIAG